MNINNLSTESLEKLADKIQSNVNENDRRKKAIITLAKYGYLEEVNHIDPDDYRPTEYKLSEKAKKMIVEESFEY